MAFFLFYRFGRDGAGKTADVPVTLYRENVKKMISPVNKVLGIFSKKYFEVSYSECTYLAKNQTIENFNLSDDIVISILNNGNAEEKEIEE